MTWCAIDFGTSNSGVAVPLKGAGAGASLVAVEDGQPTMPTAVFWFTDADEAASMKPSRARLAARLAAGERFAEHA